MVPLDSTTSHSKPTMKAVQAKDYGDIDQVLEVVEGVPRPTLSDIADPKQRNKYMILKTEAVALACGDCRVLSGRTREFQGPPSFPYIPGGDLCGIVEELPDDPETLESLPFRVGDRVAVRFVEGPRGALAEYSVVRHAVADKIPEDDDTSPPISSAEGAALAGASPAVLLADRIRPGERVLVLGAGGGVGSHFCQLCRDKVSFMVGVSQSPDRLLESPLVYDRAIDYTKEDVFSIEKFQKEPFDVIMDFSSGGWPQLEDACQRMPSIVKPASQGGRFLTTTTDHASYDIHSIGQMLQVMLFPALFRALSSRTWARKRMPAYTFALSIPSGDRSVVTRMIQAVRGRKLKAVVDPRGPFPFTTQGVRDAFRAQEARHAQGKVVIQVASTENK